MSTTQSSPLAANADAPISISGIAIGVDGKPAAKVAVYARKREFTKAGGATGGGGQSAPQLLAAAPSEPLQDAR